MNIKEKQVEFLRTYRTFEEAMTAAIMAMPMEELMHEVFADHINELEASELGFMKLTYPTTAVIKRPCSALCRVSKPAT